MFIALLHHLEATGKQPELSCVKQLKNMIALIQGESTFMKRVSIYISFNTNQTFIFLKLILTDDHVLSCWLPFITCVLNCI